MEWTRVCSRVSFAAKSITTRSTDMFEFVDYAQDSRDEGLHRRAAKTAEKVPDLPVDLAVSIDDLINRQRLSVELPDGESLKVQIPPGAVDGQSPA